MVSDEELFVQIKFIVFFPSIVPSVIVVPSNDCISYTANDQLLPHTMGTGHAQPATETTIRRYSLTLTAATVEVSWEEEEGGLGSGGDHTRKILCSITRMLEEFTLHEKRPSISFRFSSLSRIDCILFERRRRLIDRII